MAPDWPKTITSRHHHLRRRAEAFASASYYAAAASRGISPAEAAAAEETARSCHSRWWLKGNDPDHPSFHRKGSSNGKAIASCDLQAAEVGNPGSNEAGDTTDGEEGTSHTDDEDNDYAGAIQDGEEEEAFLEDNDLVPILARDDDFGSSFGTLSSFCATRRSVPHRRSVNRDAVHGSPSQVVSTDSPLLTSRLLPGKSATSKMPHISRQDIGSSEEMLQSYTSFQNQLFLAKKDAKEGHLSVPKPPIGVSEKVSSESEADESILPKYEKQVPNMNQPPLVATQVTSESESDPGDSVCSSGVSCSGASTFSRKPKDIACNSTSVPRSRKRVHQVNFSSTLEQAYLDAQVKNAKSDLLSILETEGTSLAFKSALDSLEKFTKLKASTTNKKRKLSTSSDSTTDIDGTWRMISPPDYPSCLGKNTDGDCLFTLGRMGFDMYQPSDLICSIQTQYNTIKNVEQKDLPCYVPKSLRREVDDERDGKRSGKLRTYK